MYFKLKDEVIEVGVTELGLFYQDEAQAREWGTPQGLYLTALVGTKSELFDGVEPCLSHNRGILIESELSDWKDLEGKCWTFPYDEINYNDWTDVGAGLFYAGQYTAIKCCRFEILKRDGRKFRVKWKGIVDVHWGPDFDTDIPFDCEFEVNFSGIYIPQYIADKSEKGLRETLGSLIDLDEFKLVKNIHVDNKKFIFSDESCEHFVDDTES